MPTSSSELRNTGCLKGSDQIFNLLVGKQDVGLGPDVGDEFSQLQDVGWHHRLELAVSHEYDHGMNASSPEAKEILHGLLVFIVLTERIHELVPISIDGLGPFSRSFISEDPARKVLRFDHKDPEV